jgi:hypothetical protein
MNLYQEIKFRIRYIHNLFVWSFYYKHTKKWKGELKKASEQAYQRRKELIGK